MTYTSTYLSPCCLVKGIFGKIVVPILAGLDESPKWFTIDININYGVLIQGVSGCIGTCDYVGLNQNHKKNFDVALVGFIHIYYLRGLPLITYAPRGGGGVNTNAYKCVQGGRGGV